jgi:hypothetical protein
MSRYNLFTFDIEQPSELESLSAHLSVLRNEYDLIGAATLVQVCKPLTLPEIVRRDVEKAVSRWLAEDSTRWAYEGGHHIALFITPRGESRVTTPRVAIIGFPR